MSQASKLTLVDDRSADDSADVSDQTDLIMLLVSDLDDLLTREEARAIQDSLPPHATVCKRRRYRIRRVVRGEYRNASAEVLRADVMEAQTSTIAPLYVVELIEDFRTNLRERLAKVGQRPSLEREAFLDAVFVAVLMLPLGGEP